MTTLQYTEFEFFYVSGLDDQLRDVLSQKYNIADLDVEDIFTDTQLSKVERREQYFYVSLQFPEFNKAKSQFATKEIHCVVAESFLIVIDKNEFKGVQQFMNLRENIISPDSNSFNAFYEMLDFLVTKAYKVLGKFKLEIAKVEKDIFDFEGRPTDLVKDILIIRRNMINFISLMRPLDSVLTDLQLRHNKFITLEGVEKLDDSLDKIKKMINNINNFRIQMELLTEANETLLSRAGNDTLKVLTSLSVIGLIPSIITGFFGMNIFYGWSDSETNFLPLMGIAIGMLTSTGILYMYFKMRKWV